MSEVCEKHPSGAKAHMISVCLMRGLNPRLPPEYLCISL